ncbi:MAG TPA: hypothetical protein VND21_06140, partial [Planctomycetota bacterium]|nr:hypothetical protein [Planctomycetota bacterium]
PLKQSSVDVNVYCDATDVPPTDDCFNGTHWCDVYTPQGLTPGPWDDANLVYAPNDPIPPPPPQR